MAPYEGLLREAILRTKQWTGEDLAEVLGRIWAARMRDRLAATGADVVVPIPLHWRRRWQRGFNQSEVFARCLANQLNIPCLTRALSRHRATPHQYTQTSMTARRENVKHAFRCRNAANLADKTIVLVDDILTSGATASEAAKAMRAGKPKAIYIAVLAHGR